MKRNEGQRRGDAVVVLLFAAVAAGAGTTAVGEPAAVSAGFRFLDATASAGIEYRNLSGARGKAKKWLPEAIGVGSAWLDYDGDGHLDLYIINGSTFKRGLERGEPNRMYRGDGRGHFVDVTEKTGTGHRGWGHGVAIGDIDNDGHPDLYITNLGPNALYRNRGNGTFENITSQAGVGDRSWGTSAAFFDMDGDGDLDLYVCNYVDFDRGRVPPRGTNRPNCIFRGVKVACGPLGLPAAQDVLYRNDGDGNFTDVTRDAGVRLEKPRYAMGLVTGDYDNDGDQDVYVANDSVLNSLWRNNGDGRFVEIGLTTLSALSGVGHRQAGMGTDIADYDGDGWLDIVVTNFSHDLNTIYRNVSGKFFTDESALVGMPATVMALSWGTGFHDFDSDGDLDLFIANGHVYPEMNGGNTGTRYLQKNHLFANQGGRFHEVGASSGPGLSVVRSFRGAAFGDYDQDGDVDVFVTAIDGPGLLLRNETAPRNRYLTVRLVGSTSNRDAVGARVTVVAEGRSQIRERKGGGSYLSASAPALHFGLGQATRADLVEVRWPSGRTDVLRDVAVDRVLVVTEGEQKN